MEATRHADGTWGNVRRSVTLGSVAKQAAAFDDIILGQAAVASGKINSSLLSVVEQITISGEGGAWFIPEELLPYIDDVVIHGAP